MHKNLLIIEDDKDLAGVLKRSLEKHNFVIELGDGFKNMEIILKNFHPNYAIIDLKIADKTGIDVIKFLHNFDKNMKIIMLTGYASITSTISAIKSGACYYLAKPANTEMILKAFDLKNDEEIVAKSKKTSLKNLEWEHIHQTLLEHDYNISQTARSLNMHRKTLSRKLQKNQY